MKILITGFAPFGADERNASWDAVSMLPDMVGGAALIKRQLPVEYDTVGEVLASLLAREAGRGNLRGTGGRPQRRNAGKGGYQLEASGHCRQRRHFVCRREDPFRWDGCIFFIASD